MIRWKEKIEDDEREEADGTMSDEEILSEK